MARHDDRPDVELSGPRPTGPHRRGTPPGPPVEPVAGRRTRTGSDGWRWALALGLVVAAVVAVIVFDHTSGPRAAQSAAPTTVGSTAPERERAPVVEVDLPVPDGLSGILYALGEDETLIEIDLASGHARMATLQFAIEPWFVNQVVALRETVLVTSRRAVFAVDRATLANQQRLAEESWVVAGPDGAWAALVPFGAAAGDVTILGPSGVPIGRPPLHLPAGATVEGAVDGGLVIDAAGTLQVLALDGTRGPLIGTGRFLASGGSAVARIVCEVTDCEVRTGTLMQPDQLELPPIDVAGSWYFGPAAVFDPVGRRLAAVTRSAGTSGSVTLHELVPQPLPRVVASPAAVAEPGPLPAIAFTADGSTVAHTSPTGIALWRVGTEGSAGAATEADELPFASPLLAITVAPQPPPPPPQSSGPPPSYA